MALMIPDQIGKDTVSYAEKKLFNRLRSELSDDYIVLHSLGISRHVTHRWGECDFVLISPKGIFFIEVKGGGVACEDGIWKFTDRFGNSNTSTQSPWSQASKAMFSIKNQIESTGGVSRLLYGFGVIMPDEEFLQTGPEIEQNYLLDRRLWNEPLSNYFFRLETVWIRLYNEKRGKKYNPLNRALREKVRQLLRPDSKSVYTLASRLSNVERELVELTAEQNRIFDRMQNTDRMIITGSAGTGKTLLAFDQAKRLASNGLKVLFLCFNRLLGKHLEENCASEGNLNSNLTVSTLHSFYNKSIVTAGLSSHLSQFQKQNTDEKFYKEAFPRVFMDAFEEVCTDLFDAMIIDEGQDILSPAHLDALDLTLDKGFVNGRWWIFLDRMQNLYNNDEISSALDYLNETSAAHFRLTANCRNSLEVALTTSIVSGLDIAIKGAIDGGLRKTVYYREGELNRKLDKTVSKLIEEGLNYQDLILLSSRQLLNSSLSKISRINGSRILDLSNDESGKGIDFCTMHAFKGLERKVVIAMDIYGSMQNHLNNKLLLYSGLSRGRTGLILMVPESEKNAHEADLRTFADRLPGLKYT